jgi:hypothetical protein
MPIAKLRQDYAQPSPQATPQLTTELDGFAPTLSPALALQRQLAQHATTANGAEVAKWSARRSVTLIVSASIALWLAILVAGAEASKIIA